MFTYYNIVYLRASLCQFLNTYWLRWIFDKFMRKIFTHIYLMTMQMNFGQEMLGRLL